MLNQFTLGYSVLNEAILAYSSQSSFQHKPIFLLLGGVHADEVEGIHLVNQFVNHNLSQYSNYPDLSVVCIPCLNVDGFKRNQRVNANGIDLNLIYQPQIGRLKLKTHDIHLGRLR